MSLLKSTPKSVFLLWIILLLGSVYLFRGSMDTYPAYLHAWTQSDRLAIAQNFQNNGFDFFHPATFNLLTKDGVTQVDFPIHDYAVAVIGHILNTNLVSTFRWYNLIWSLIGFTFLFLATLRLNPNPLRGIFLTIFIATLPFYVYYQNGFLPSTTAIATLFMGLYFLIRGIQNKNYLNFILSALFVGLSALCRSPFLFQLLAFGGVIVMLQFRKRKFTASTILPFFIMGLFFVAYYLYNRALSIEYGSMFLQEFLNLRSFSELFQVVEQSLDRWSDQLLSPFHAIVLLSIFIAAMVQFKNAKPSKHLTAIGLLVVFSILTSSLFFILMGRQFVDHDYYYLSVFIPILTYSLLFANQYLTIDRRYYTPIATVCGIFIFYFYSQSQQVLTNRYTPDWDDRIEYAYGVYERAEKDIKSWGIHDTDTLTILEANSTNIPFTIWNKRGYTSLNSKAELVDSILKFPKTYVVMIDSFFRLDTYRDYPHLIDRLKLEHTNGEISFYTDHPNKPSSKDFFDHHIFSTHIDFEQQSAISEQYSGYKISSFKGNKFNVIDSTTIYNLTYADTLNNLNAQKPIQITLVADYLAIDSVQSIQLVCQTPDYYFTHYLENTLTLDSDWEKVQFNFKISPEQFSNQSEIKIYYYNPKGKKLSIDNYHLILYQ